MSKHPAKQIFEQLGDSELDLLLQLVLASGSLKQMASKYGVSYPTIRSRLDRLIARVQGLQEERSPDPMAHKLADLVEAGQLAPAAGHALLKLHRQILAVEDEG
jgi:hypothetical protein